MAAARWKRMMKAKMINMAAFQSDPLAKSVSLFCLRAGGGWLLHWLETVLWRLMLREGLLLTAGTLRQTGWAAG